MTNVLHVSILISSRYALYSIPSFVAVKTTK